MLLLRARDDDATELLDAEAGDPAALRDNLRDIRHINALLGWTSFTRRSVARHVRQHGLASFSLLDVASGSADIPLAVAHWAEHAGVTARIVATDISPQIVTIAREMSADTPSITVEQQDALHLLYPAGSFDIALCTLALHHFAPEQAVEVLRNLARVGRRVLVFDVVRASLAYLGVVALTRLLRMNYMTCHDGPVSVRRAYSSAEVRDMAAQAGLRHARVSVAFPFRLVLEAEGIRDTKITKFHEGYEN